LVSYWRRRRRKQKNKNKKKKKKNNLFKKLSAHHRYIL
jgi:hypothetical protein